MTKEHAAAKEFAHLNGWRFVADKTFPISALGGVDIAPQNDWLFDNALYFWESAPPHRPIAIVGQPVGNFDPTTTWYIAQDEAPKLGLRIHFPPRFSVSLRDPGCGEFFCFTRPQIERVQFLPEQMGAIDDGG